MAPELLQSSTLDVEVLCQKKEDLVVGAAGTKSLRDFGGLYLVHGRYLLEPAIALNAEFASMIDAVPRPEFAAQVQRAKERNPVSRSSLSRPTLAKLGCMTGYN